MIVSVDDFGGLSRDEVETLLAETLLAEIDKEVKIDNSVEFDRLKSVFVEYGLLKE